MEPDLAGYHDQVAIDAHRGDREVGRDEPMEVAGPCRGARHGRSTVAAVTSALCAMALAAAIGGSLVRVAQPGPEITVRDMYQRRRPADRETVFELLRRKTRVRSDARRGAPPIWSRGRALSGERSDLDRPRARASRRRPTYGDQRARRSRGRRGRIGGRARPHRF